MKGRDTWNSSRRALLGAVAAGAVAVAGCSSQSDDDTANQSGDDPSNGDAPESETSDSEPAASSDPPVRGDPEAAVTLEVYEDFSCPHCRTYNVEQLPALAEAYLEPGRLRYEHRDFPFIDEQSWQAANAAREAYLHHGNEAFWAYKSELFARQSEVGSNAPEIFGQIATDLELDADRIQTAAEQRRHDDILQGDKARGERQGVPGTPAFVLDGELVEGNLRDEIDAALS